MPRKNARSQQAKAQRASGKRGFDSGITENPFDQLLDPDYEDPVSEEEESEDEIEQEIDTNYAFSISDYRSQDAVKNGQDMEESNSTVSTDSDTENEYSDFETEQAFNAAERVKQQVKSVSLTLQTQIFLLIA